MNSIKWLVYGSATVVALALAIVAGVPTLREAVQQHFARVGREVLATADGDALNDGSTAKVMKFRGAEETIFVEVLKVDAQGESKLVDRIVLPDKHDGFFNYQGHVTRLAIADIDNDGQNELIVPTFDNQLVPHLNVFRYSSTLHRFELYQPGK